MNTDSQIIDNHINKVLDTIQAIMDRFHVDPETALQMLRAA